jgi:DNA replication protein
MNIADGFPDKSKFTPIPNLLFGQVLEKITDIKLLKCLLRLMFMQNQKKGFPRFVTWKELVSDRVLMINISDETQSNVASNHLEHNFEAHNVALVKTLHKLESMGLILTVNEFESIDDLKVSSIFLVNNEEGRKGLKFIINNLHNEININPRDIVNGSPQPLTQDLSNIFSLYEDNIGVIGYIMAEELKEAEKNYPESWLVEAFKEAILQNKRSWSYIKAILNNWTENGKGSGNGEFGGHSKKLNSREWIKKHGLPRPK